MGGRHQGQLLMASPKNGQFGSPKKIAKAMIFRVYSHGRHYVQFCILFRVYSHGRHYMHFSIAFRVYSQPSLWAIVDGLPCTLSRAWAPLCAIVDGFPFIFSWASLCTIFHSLPCLLSRA